MRRRRASGQDRYGVAKAIHPDGTKFDSKKEMHRYCALLLLRKAKLIDCLELQPRIPIIIKGVAIKYFIKTGRRQMFYVADFKYFDRERHEWVLEDVKGHRTEVYKIKRALVAAMGVTIEEV
jgi:hypothetical protein